MDAELSSILTPPIGVDVPLLEEVKRVSPLTLLNSYSGLFLIAFLVTLLLTPLIRRLAIALDIVDRPDQKRKQHAMPIAYLGGFAVFFGIIAAIGYSYTMTAGMAGIFAPIPVSIVLGIIAIPFTGLADDVWGWDPRLKIAGQLVAAAALAAEQVGVRVAEGALVLLLGDASDTLLELGPLVLQNGDLYYWLGTAIIAIFVLGGCNAANLIDGLDGLLSGTIFIQMAGLLVICIMMATSTDLGNLFESEAGARIAICLAVMGAVLGFLPWNFNPAVIFLGDCGSLLLGYLTVVVILMLGERGDTKLVLAGVIVFGLPIMDTALAIVRRKLAGVSFSTADANHIHHQVRRAVGGVKGAVFALYGIALAFTATGVTLAWLVLFTKIRTQIVFALAIVLFGFIGAVAFKAARRQQFELGKETNPAVPASAAKPLSPTAAPSDSPRVG
jgi:UDP-GlcNAc:undecaprenyl-phosphate GlcNAc-1-phosphate transferase